MIPFKLSLLLVALIAPLVLGQVVPANDLCVNANTAPAPITCGAVVQGTTIGATIEDNVSECGVTITAPGVWYQLTGTGEELVFTETISATFDTKISVFETNPLLGAAANCNALTCIGGDDDGGGAGGLSKFSFLSTAGAEYLILVHGFGSNVGNFELSVECSTPLVNDKCINADTAPITCGNVVQGTTTNASPDDNVSSCGVSITSPGVWYELTGTGEDIVVTETIGATFDTKISVFVAGDCDALVCIGGNDDDGVGILSQFTFPSTAGTAYLILVHGFASNTGDFELRVECVLPPVNDQCSTATPITCDNVVQGTTLGASFDDTGTCGTDVTAPAVWYQLTGTGEDVVLTETISASFDTKISIFEAGDCNDLTDLTCIGGNNNGGVGVLSKFFFPSTAGTEYLILVHGGVGATGNFELSVECSPPPVNDQCINAAAAPITCGETVLGSTRFATTEDNVSSCGVTITAPGVWYELTGTGEDIVVTETIGPNSFDTKISIFEAGDCNALTCVGGADDGGVGRLSNYTFPSTAGTEYLILVHGFISATGNFELSVECTPLPCSCNDMPPGSPVCSNCGVSGDPHFKTWTGDKYDFHGECDLVLIQNPEFKSGLGMHVHTRTKAWGRYSSIETAAVRIGEDTLEVQADGDKTHHWINGVADAELPGALSGFPIEYTEVGKGKKKLRVYTISLDGDEKIVVNTVKKLVQVLFKNAAKDSFADSVGLMGAFETGSRLARDGKTVIKKWDPFGQEWQVRSSDPSLFQLADGPQYPDKCVMPLITSKATKQRRLSESAVGEAEAAKACAHVILDARDECIFDVLATGDVEMVDIYDTVTASVH